MKNVQSQCKHNQSFSECSIQKSNIVFCPMCLWAVVVAWTKPYIWLENHVHCTYKKCIIDDVYSCKINYNDKSEALRKTCSYVFILCAETKKRFYFGASAEQPAASSVNVILLLFLPTNIIASIIINIIWWEQLVYHQFEFHYNFLLLFFCATENFCSTWLLCRCV